MPDIKQKLEFFGKLGDVQYADEKAAKRREERGQLLEKVLAEGLPQSEREQLRQQMSFEIELREGTGKVKSMDGRGQRESIETEDVRDRYKSLGKDENAAAYKAMEKIARMKQRLLEQKGSDGKPLFTEEDLATELFTPLVREGLMPENLVIDKHSETSQLLKETYESYRKMLEKARKKDEKKDAEEILKLYGASGGGLDVLKAAAKRVGRATDDKTRVLGGKMGLTREQTKRFAKMGMTAAKTVYRANKLVSTSQKLDQVLQTGQQQAKSRPGGEKIAKDVVKVLTKGVSGGIETALLAKEHLDSKKIGKKANRKAAVKKAAEEVARKVEAAIAAELVAVCPQAKGALDGRLVAAVKPGDMAEAITRTKQAAPARTALCDGIEKALSGMVAAPAEAVKALKTAAEAIRTALANSGVDTKVAEAMDFHTHKPEDVFDAYVEPARSAAKTAFGAQGFAEALEPAGSGLEDTARRNVELNQLIKDRKLTEDSEDGEDDDDDDDEDKTLFDVLKEHAVFAVVEIEEIVADQMLQAFAHPPGALQGKVVDAVDLAQVLVHALGEDSDSGAIGQLIGDAVAAALRGLAPKEGPAGNALEAAAVTFAQGYPGRVARTDFKQAREALDSDPEAFFAAFVAAAGPAAEEAFKQDAFLNAKDSLVTALQRAAKDNNADMLLALESSDERVQEFERQLTLIDESGEAMARQQSLQKLIGQLEKDRLDLEIVNQTGSLLGSFGISVVRLGVDSSNSTAVNVMETVATEVGQSLVPAMKAAQLVMQMAVNVIEIAKRAQLVKKFEADVEKALKARTPLLPAVQNFYNAKKGQQLLAKAELALQTVQLAGQVCASVPEPVTMAVGRLMAAVGKLAAEGKKLGEQIYTHQQLEKGWAITLEAMNNPANRRAGLDALHINGTLAMHAVAWAAMENDDPVARELLRSCGVEAQTLADSESDQETVIEYLETLLHEDLEFKDEGRIETRWVPKPLVLSFPAWFTVQQRARTQAVPKMATPPLTALDDALRRMDLQPTTDAITAAPEAHDAGTLAAWVAEVEAVELQLRLFEPRTADNQSHTAMLQVRERLLDLAGTRRRALQKLHAQALQRPPTEPPPQQDPPQDPPQQPTGTGEEQSGGRSRSGAQTRPPPKVGQHRTPKKENN